MKKTFKTITALIFAGTLATGALFAEPKPVQVNVKPEPKPMPRQPEPIYVPHAKPSYKPTKAPAKKGPKPVDGYDPDMIDFDGYIEIHTASGLVLRLSPDDFKLSFDFYR